MAALLIACKLTGAGLAPACTRSTLEGIETTVTKGFFLLSKKRAQTPDDEYAQTQKAGQTVIKSIAKITRRMRRVYSISAQRERD